MGGVGVEKGPGGRAGGSLRESVLRDLLYVGSDLLDVFADPRDGVL